MTPKGATARRERARAEMREAILQSARKLVSAGGADGFSMRAVARDLGYSPAALYEYFPGKEEIFCALYLEGSDGLAGRLRRALAEAAVEATPVERVMALGRAYRAFALENAGLFRLAFGANAPLPDAEGQEFGREAFQILIDEARAGVQAGAFRPIEPEAIALACWAVVHGFVMIEIAGMIERKLGRGGPTADELFEITLQLAGGGFVNR